MLKRIPNANINPINIKKQYPSSSLSPKENKSLLSFSDSFVDKSKYNKSIILIIKIKRFNPGINEILFIGER